jgi:hypothetical protein
MPLPDDTLGRWWIELAGTNPNLVDDFRSCLVAFVAFDRGTKPGLAGTGFIIGTGENIALAITAKHVLTEDRASLSILVTIKASVADYRTAREKGCRTPYPGYANRY